MNAKQKRFADEYLVDCNATQAAIRAGYSEKSAGRNADRMMKNDEIKKYIEEQLEHIHNERIFDLCNAWTAQGTDTTVCRRWYAENYRY